VRDIVMSIAAFTLGRAIEVQATSTSQTLRDRAAITAA